MRLGDLRVRPDARAALHDRILVATNSVLPSQLGATLAGHDAHSGIVATGGAAITPVRKLRAALSGIVSAVDPAYYETYAATADRPFDGAAAGDEDALPMSGRSPLGFYVADQARSFDAVFSPTGYLGPAAHDALAAVIEECNLVDDPRLVTLLPVDKAWLVPAARELLIECIAASRHLTALVIVSQYDPYADRDVGSGLVELLAKSGENLVLHRTDMAAVHAFARGMAGATIGTTASLRHAVPPGQHPWTRRAKDGKRPPRLPVLVPGIDEFHDVGVLEEWFGDDAPRCTTVPCCGRRLTAFDPADVPDKDAAANHNVASWLAVAEDLLSTAQPYRRRWLDHYRMRVNTAFGELRAQTRNRKVQPSGGTQFWLDCLN